RSCKLARGGFGVAAVMREYQHPVIALAGHSKGAVARSLDELAKLLGVRTVAQLSTGYRYFISRRAHCHRRTFGWRAVGIQHLAYQARVGLEQNIKRQ